MKVALGAQAGVPALLGRIGRCAVGREAKVALGAQAGVPALLGRMGRCAVGGEVKVALGAQAGGACASGEDGEARCWAGRRALRWGRRQECLRYW